MVLFAHGSGSSRHSARNRVVATALREANLGTFLFDLLSPQEEAIDLRTTRLRFDVAFLAQRLLEAMRWVRLQEDMQRLPLGLFGSSTGAAAALIAAAYRPGEVAAVVSRGGRPDLADVALKDVQAPTLLIVGGNDGQVVELNRLALEQLRCERKLEIIPRATHLFEEPGALEQVASLAGEWFTTHMRGG
jgi:putative phosphoribosyl transferase